MNATGGQPLKSIMPILFQNRYKSIICQEDVYFKEVIYSRGRCKIQVAARSLLCYWAVCELGYTATELAKQLGMTQPAVSYAVSRGEQIAKENSYNLIS